MYKILVLSIFLIVSNCDNKNNSDNKNYKKESNAPYTGKSLNDKKSPTNKVLDYY